MKKILIALSIVMCIAGTQSVDAQTSLYGANSLTKDTVTNTATKNMTLQTGITSFRTTITVQVDITRISGTLAGTLTPVASNDGTTYYAIRGVSTADTAVTITNAATSGYAYHLLPGWKYYGVRYTGSGTMSASIVAKLNQK